MYLLHLRELPTYLQVKHWTSEFHFTMTEEKQRPRGRQGCCAQAAAEAE